METRTFNFPNNGHSVRKLALALEELGTEPVSIQYQYGQYNDVEFEMWYESDIGGVPANVLAQTVKSLGTRFVCKVNDADDTVEISFYTDQSDIRANRPK